MKPQKSKKRIPFLKFLPLMVCILFIILFLASDNDITVQTVLEYTPESPFAAAMVILLLYALKSVTFVFPIAVLQIATGHLFRMPVALLINFLGRAVTLSIPYWVGRASGSDMIRNLRGQLISWCHQNTFSLLYTGRCLGNSFRRSIGDNSWFQYYRAWFACILAFGFVDGFYGCHFRYFLSA